MFEVVVGFFNPPPIDDVGFGLLSVGFPPRDEFKVPESVAFGTPIFDCIFAYLDFDGFGVYAVVGLLSVVALLAAVAGLLAAVVGLLDPNAVLVPAVLAVDAPVPFSFYNVSTIPLSLVISSLVFSIYTFI